MAVIYMEHPKHGTKVACMEDEAKADEAHGWVRMSVAALLKPAPAPTPAAVQPEPENGLIALREAYEARFGRKPHHKKTAATLRAELEA